MQREGQDARPPLCCLHGATEVADNELESCRPGRPPLLPPREGNAGPRLSQSLATVAAPRSDSVYAWPVLFMAVREAARAVRTRRDVVWQIRGYASGGPFSRGESWRRLLIQASQPATRGRGTQAREKSWMQRVARQPPAIRAARSCDPMNGSFQREKNEAARPQAVKKRRAAPGRSAIFYEPLRRAIYSHFLRPAAESLSKRRVEVLVRKAAAAIRRGCRNRALLASAIQFGLHRPRTSMPGCRAYESRKAVAR